MPPNSSAPQLALPGPAAGVAPPCPHCGRRADEAPHDVRRVLVPVATVSEANAHAHYRGRQGRAKRQREAVGWALKARLGPLTTAPVLIRLVRIAPTTLDAHDNLPAALKACADAVARWVGIDDRHLRFAYGQERGGPYDHAVRVELEFLPGTAPAERGR